MSSLSSAGIGRALVVGAGVTGRAVAAALREAGVGVVVTDPEVSALASLPDDVEAVASDDARPLLARVDLVVPSPGVPATSPLLEAALEAGLPVWSEPELAARLRPDRTVLGITGTNGKTTVTELVARMCNDGGVDAVSCGNIGTPLVEAVLDPGDATLVAELSSFQLHFCSTLRCRVGVVLNVAPDHLDWHGTFEAYRAAKARLWAGQTTEDWAVGPAQPRGTRPVLEAAPGRVARFSGEGPVELGVGVEEGAFVARTSAGKQRLAGVDDLASGSGHMVANTAAAATVALLAGADPDGVAAAAGAYHPGPHRTEVVTTHRGITWVDDSKATNPHATVAALASDPPSDGATIWIAGGLAKGVDLQPLASALGGVRHAVLLGEAAGQLEQVCRSAGVAATVIAGASDPMRAAVRAAAGVAHPGDRVLLSPACASFDLFDGYADRGERFAAAVRDLVGEHGR